MKIEKILDWGIILEDIMKIWGSYDKRYINLKKIRGKDFNPSREQKIVDYPWEYHFKLSDKKDVYIVVLEWKEKKLNFIIEWLIDKTVAFIQNKDLLESESFDNIDVWLFEDPEVESFLDKLEYEWEKVLVK